MPISVLKMSHKIKKKWWFFNPFYCSFCRFVQKSGGMPISWGKQTGMEVRSGNRILSGSTGNRPEAVTLLSYADSSQTKTGFLQNRHLYSKNRLKSKSVTGLNQESGIQTYSVHQSSPSPCSRQIIQSANSTKFFKNLKKRSRSASRLNQSNLSKNSAFYGSDFSLYDSCLDLTTDKPKLTYTANGDKARNPDKSVKPEKVTLVGFSSNFSADLAPDPPLRKTFSSCENLYQPASRKISGSASRTSREVKMERERLRKERLKSRLQSGQPDPDFTTKDWFERKRQEVLSEHNAMLHHSRLFGPSRPRFAATEDLFGDSRSDEMFNQFVKENQERFAQLVQSAKAGGELSKLSAVGNNSFHGERTTAASNNNSVLSAPSSKFSLLRQQRNNNSKLCESASTTSSPAEIVASILNNKKVHKIEIVRENNTDIVNKLDFDEEEDDKLTRSSSGSSSRSSSGFSSLSHSSRSGGGPNHHHFANHFGLVGRLNHGPQMNAKSTSKLQKTSVKIMSGGNEKVTKSKSVEYTSSSRDGGGSGATFR